MLDPAGPFLIPLLLLLVSRVVLAVILPLAAEDAYITFRYGRSLATGNGLVFNPGEKVMGFTSPAWTLWNALGFLLTRNPVLWSRATAIAADVVTLLLVGRMLARELSRAAAWAFTLFWAAWPYCAAVAVSGMENAPMLALIAFAAAAAGGRSIVAGPLLGLLALWRPEGVAAAAVLALGARPRERWIGAALATLGFAALALYYGSAIPQSLLSKASLYGTPGPWAGRYWWSWLSPALLGEWPTTAETNNLFPLVVLFAPACVFGARELWARRATPLAATAAAALAVWLGYVVTGASYFYWYFVVPLGGLAILAAAGVPRVVRGRAVPIAAALFVLGMWSVAIQLYLGRAQNEYYMFARVGTVLRERATPGQTVMLEPIGIVGWYAPLRVIDEVGLVTPAIARRRLGGPGWYADAVAERRPDWLVVRRGVVESGEAFAGAGQPFRSPAERDSLFAAYALVEEADPRSGAGALRVYRRAQGR